MTNPLLSIITVSLNSERSIERALKSVHHQEPTSLQKVEHWLVDGGSTDHTVALAKLFPHVKIQSEKDNGIANAFNKGVKLAQGKWILFLNSDDELADSNVLRDVLEHLQSIKDPKLQVVYGKINLVEPNTQKSLGVVGRDKAWTFLTQRMTLPHPATFISAEYFKTFGLFDETFRIAMDYELLLRGYDKVRFKFVDRVITNFSQGGISVKKAGWEQASECLRAKEKNHITTAPQRFFWWGYQGLRWTVESKAQDIPLVGPGLKYLSKWVARGF